MLCGRSELIDTFCFKYNDYSCVNQRVFRQSVWHLYYIGDLYIALLEPKKKNCDRSSANNFQDISLYSYLKPLYKIKKKKETKVIKN